MQASKIKAWPAIVQQAEETCRQIDWVVTTLIAHVASPHTSLQKVPDNSIYQKRNAKSDSLWQQKQDKTISRHISKL